MESMISAIKILYKDISSRKILDGEIDYKKFPKEEFAALLGLKNDAMSGNDIEQLYYYLITTIRENSNVNEERENSAEDDDSEDNSAYQDKLADFSVLDALKVYVNKVLTQTKGEPVCKYRRLMAWRMISATMDEDTFTTAFLAIQDMEKVWSERTDFDWRTIIGHDNYELNNLLKKGTVENHYHLKGSAPYFAITWLNLMNDINNKDFRKYLEDFDRHRLTRDLYPAKNGYEPSYVEMHLQAALIRCYLYCRLTDKNFDVFDNYSVSIDEVDYYFAWKGNRQADSVSKEVVEIVLRTFEKTGVKRVSGQSFLYSLFRNEKSADDFWNTISEIISGEHLFEIVDIRRQLAESGNNISLRKLVNIFIGKLKYVQIPVDKVELLICPKLQKQFIKENSYSNVYFCLNTPGMLFEIRNELQDFISGLRVYGTDYTPTSFMKRRVYDYIAYLPSEHEGEPYCNIKRTERWFLYNMFLKLYSNDAEFQTLGNLFYAYLIIKERIHSELVQVNSKKGFDNFLRYQDRKEYFIENTKYEELYSQVALQDTWNSQKASLIKLEARIAPKMKAVENRNMVANLERALKAPERDNTFYVFHFVKSGDDELLSGKEQCRHYKKRVEVRKKAIAIEQFRRRYPKEASKVYGIDACSPEIGCRPEVFAQAFTYLRGMQESAKRYSADIPWLGISYHVGEDFLDIIDGLRAIDEAIHFLHMDSGDRLGHALALGVNPIEWYEFKGNHVLVSKQDFIDNIVWIYMKIRKYHIKHSEDLMQSLYRYFTHFFKEVYGTKPECDINLYYDAWKLRGDDPELYISEELGKPDLDVEWNYFAKNECFPENCRIRKQKQCSVLVGMYHYDDDVKRKGAEVTEYKVSAEIKEVIIQIQKCMQKEVAKLGISIETNPSSNYMIGTFERYDRHPIRNFYNKGLTVNNEELAENPQIDVTINTDDQAVFSTCLDNEFAYIALSLEKLKDKNGNFLYKRSMIYEWLDNIRENGNKVCFMQDVRRLQSVHSQERVRGKDYEE